MSPTDLPLKERTRLGDFGRALNALDWELEQHDQAKGARWREETVWTHLHHAVLHLVQALFALGLTATGAMHIRHAYCRVTMAVQLLEEARTDYEAVRPPCPDR